MTRDTLEQIAAELYSALNDADLDDDLARSHVRRAYKLAADAEEQDDSDLEPRLDEIHGSILVEDLYPDRSELDRRVREHASDKFDFPEIDTSPETWEVVYVRLEDGVALYRIEHDKLGRARITESGDYEFTVGDA